MVMPYFKCFMDGKEFLVMHIVVLFSGAECPRMEGNGVELSISCMNGMYGSNGIVRGVSFN